MLHWLILTFSYSYLPYGHIICPGWVFITPNTTLPPSSVAKSRGCRGLTYMFFNPWLWLVNTRAQLTSGSCEGISDLSLWIKKEWGGLTFFNLFCLCWRRNVVVLFALVTDDSNIYFLFVGRYKMTHCPSWTPPSWLLMNTANHPHQ